MTWPDHIHHQNAVHYWELQAAAKVLFYTVTALGLVRLMSQPKLTGTAYRNPAAASSLLEAHLAALAIANGWLLVSCDRDFERFQGLDKLHPLPVISMSPGNATGGAPWEDSGWASAPSC